MTVCKAINQLIVIASNEYFNREISVKTINF